jgi:hypothetical protein
MFQMWTCEVANAVISFQRSPSRRNYAFARDSLLQAGLHMLSAEERGAERPSEHKIRRSALASFYRRLFKNFAQPSMMAGLDSISTKMYFNPPTFAAAKKSFQSTMPAPMTTSFLWLSGA